MDFWGVEVKSGEPCSVEAGEGRILHLSQACLGEVKKDKGNESVYLYVTVDGKKLVLGTLSSEKFPQLQFDLVFQNQFELSHSWKNGSVYFHGYRCDTQSDVTEDESEDESEEDLPANAAVLADNEKPESQAMRENPPATQNATTARPDSAASKKKVKIVEPKKDVKTVEEEDSSEDKFGTDSEDDSDSDEDEEEDSESGEGDTEDDDEEEETPRKVEPSQKRPAESTSATEGHDKRAKFVTPQKTETKKSGGRVDTPYPSKQAGKTPANQLKQQTPKPAGSHPCKSCNRSFNSDIALDSHTKAKHTSGK